MLRRPSVEFSRRRFLQLGAAAAATAGWPRPTLAGPGEALYDDGNAAVPGGRIGDPERVIVVGAGFAGLAAANALANAGVEVVLLEARSRIGGRAKTRDVVGLPVDQGCSWIHGPIGNIMSQWAEQVGVGATPAAFEDDIGTFTGYDAATGPLSATDIVQVFFQTLLFDNELGRLYAALGDRATLEDAIDRFLDQSGFQGDLRRRTNAVLRYVNESGFAASVSDVSLAALFDFPDDPNPGPSGGSDVFPVGGYRALYEPLAAGLDVRFGHRVHRITHDENGVVVRARVKSGRRRVTEVFRGSHVIVTLPLGVLKAARVRYAPLLPIPKVRAIQRMGVGYLEKISIGFDEPFWQEGGKTHLFYGSTTLGEFPAFLDLQHLSGGPVLQCFVAGDFGRRMSRMPRRDIEARTLEILREVYGAAVPRPRQVRISRWFSDPYTRGSYTNLPVGSTYRDMATLAEPVGGRLLFAGEATDVFSSATADGAFTTGVREAKRLLGVPAVRMCPLAGAHAFPDPTADLGRRLFGWRERALA